MAAASSWSYPECVAVTDAIAVAFKPAFITIRCNFCTNPATPGATLLRCSGCTFAHYCGVECQSKAWHEHKAECKRLAGKLKTWRTFEPKYASGPYYASEFQMTSLLLFRLLLKRDSGALASTGGNYSGKKFSDLSSNELDLLDDERVLRERKFHEMLDVQRCAGFLYDADIDDATILEYCEKIFQNAVDFCEGSPGGGEPHVTGIAIYFDCATLSCRPKVQLVPAGATVRVVPLPGPDGRPLVDGHSPTVIVRESCRLLATKGVRRGEVERLNHLTCVCERCVDPDDDLLSAITCENCQAPVPLDDSSFRHFPTAKFGEKAPLSAATLKRVRRILPVFLDARRLLVLESDAKQFDCKCLDEFKSFQLVCSSCATKVSPERVEFALALMVAIESITSECEVPLERLNGLKRFDAECGKVLPECNLYRAKLHRLMADDLCIDAEKRADRVLSWYGVVQKCIPRAHPLLRPELRSLCEALIAAARFDKLRVALADYLQMSKIHLCIGQQQSQVILYFAMFEKRLGCVSSATDFSSALSKVGDAMLIGIASEFLITF